MEVPAILMGARSAPKICHLPAWLVVVTWVDIRSQVLVLSPQLAPDESGLESPVGKGGVRLLL